MEFRNFRSAFPPPTIFEKFLVQPMVSALPARFNLRLVQTADPTSPSLWKRVFQTKPDEPTYKRKTRPAHPGVPVHAHRHMRSVLWFDSFSNTEAPTAC